MLDNLPSGPEAALAASPRSFTKEEEECKREEFLRKNTSRKLTVLSAAITFAERNLPPHLRRNRPRPGLSK
jgi:hypothetical protein